MLFKEYVIILFMKIISLKLIIIISFISISVFARMDFEKRGKWLNVFPLGVGQYQNYQVGKAFLFLLGESVLLGSALGLAVVNHNKDNKNLERYELASFISFLLLYSWGVYDAFVNYERADKKIRESLEKKFKVEPKVSNKHIGMNMTIRF